MPPRNDQQRATPPLGEGLERHSASSTSDSAAVVTESETSAAGAGAPPKDFSGAVGCFYDADSGGPLRVELVSAGPKSYRMLRRVAYRHASYETPFVFPTDVHTYSTDMASVPAMFQWIVPANGKHLPAVLLHDALVPDRGNHGRTYIGPDVSREEADGIMRDAMGDLGVGFARRWIAWTGALLGTAWEDFKRRWYWRTVTAGTFAVVVVIGVIASLDLIDAVALMPLMGQRPPFEEIRNGMMVGMIAVPVLSALWGRRWAAGLISYAVLVFALHITLAMGIAWVVYQAVEWGATKMGYRLPESEVTTEYVRVMTNTCGECGRPRP